MTLTPQIAQAIKSLRPLPRVAQRVLEIAQDPEYDIGELTAVVRTDPSLVARVLRLCNSARSALGSEIHSVQDAVSYLGTRNLVQLVLVTCSAGLYAAERKTVYFEPAALWHHAVAFGVTCQVLAAHSDVAPAAAFTAGVLHDVGTMVLDQLVDAEQLATASRAANGRSPSLVDFERQCFGIDHATANRLLADCWRLPPALAQGMSLHHDEALATADDALPAIVHLAEVLLAGTMPCRTPALADAHSGLTTMAMVRLGFDAEQLDASAARATEEVAKLAEVLNLHATGNR